MNEKAIKLPVNAIFFDAAETLFKIRGSVGELYLQIARKYGSKADKGDIDEAFFNVFKQKPSPVFAPDISPNERMAIEKQWWYEVVHRVFTEVGMIPSFESYFQEVYTVFKGSQGWELFPETVEVLGLLKKKGYSLGMITNFDTRVYEVAKALGISPLFDSMTLSSEAGAPKPDPLIFQKAVEAHRVKPAEAIHVGDSLSDDVGGALKSGLQAVLIDRNHLFKPGKDFVRIESLSELLDYL